MKRALLGILILATGTSVFCALRSATTGVKRDLTTQTSAWQTRTQQCTQLRFEKQLLLERTIETRQLLAAQAPLPALGQLAEKILSGAPLKNLSADESEQLLAELGFNWNTTGDYLIVSKKSLEGISFDGMKEVKLTIAAREVLAVTPAEQTAIEAMTRQLGEARTAWAKEHVQRTEPGGNVLAQYSLPADAEFSQSQFAIFTNGILGTLGEERGHWLQDHSWQWTLDAGLRTGPDMPNVPAELFATMPVSAFQAQPTTLTLEQYQSGNEWRINYTVKQAGNTMTTSVGPWQPFPEAFHSIFPGGWRELAEREGFELPPEFKKQETNNQQ